MAQAKFVAVLPRKFRDDKARFVLLRALEKQGDIAKKIFESTTSTWEEHHPKFERRSLSTKGNELSVVVGTDDEIYGYLNEGTDVRRVRVTPDWKSKTAPGRLIPTGGAGEVAGFGVFPGIDARHFDEMVEDAMDATFQEAMVDAVVEAARQSDHGG